MNWAEAFFYSVCVIVVGYLSKKIIEALLKPW
jgi:hypothetical protein